MVNLLSINSINYPLRPFDANSFFASSARRTVFAAMCPCFTAALPQVIPYLDGHLGYWFYGDYDWVLGDVLRGQPDLSRIGNGANKYSAAYCQSIGCRYSQRSHPSIVLIGILLGFAGIAIIGLNGALDNNADTVYGVIYIVCAALGIAISNVLLKKNSNQIDIFYAMSGQLIIGSLPLMILVPTIKIVPALSWDLTYFAILMMLAIPGTALPFLIWFWLMDKAPLNQLNIFSFLTPIFGLVIGWVYFEESLSPWQWVGVVTVIVGVVISVLPKPSAPKK